MTFVILALALIGLSLSAFFSGTETGFYRAARVRLVLDALGGDSISGFLVWLTNHPTLFVATTLVGNNMANYLVSLATVLGTQVVFGAENQLAGLLSPIALAPFLFVYGELLPKKVFLQSPNRLLRLVAPVFALFFVLFSPISMVLWGLNLALARLTGQSPRPVRLTLARRELQNVLEEGGHAGLLRASQQNLARAIFALADQPAAAVAVPLAESPVAQADMTRDAILDLARRHGAAEIPVEDAAEPGSLIGYFRVVDLQLAAVDAASAVRPMRPLPVVRHTENHVAVLARMEDAGETLAQVVDSSGRAFGLLTAARLREPLFRGA